VDRRDLRGSILGRASRRGRDRAGEAPASAGRSPGTTELQEPAAAPHEATRNRRSRPEAEFPAEGGNSGAPPEEESWTKTWEAGLTWRRLG
jgi:hypothetical protein